MEELINILLLEDNLNDAELIHRQVVKARIKFQWLHTSKLEAFKEALTDFKPDLILSDYHLGGFTGLDALDLVVQKCPHIPFIIVTGALDDEIAVETIKKGASDYVVKERLVRLGMAIKNALLLKEEKENSAIDRERLKISEERYKLSVEGSKDGIWDVNLITKDVYYSKRWKSMLGYGDDELERNFQTWVSLLHPDDKMHTLAALDKHLKNETSHYEVEFRLRCKNGSYKWILARAKAMFNHNGIAYRIAGSHTDISDRKKIEEELRLNNIVRDSLLRTIPFGMHIVDENGTILFQSESFKALVGCKGIGRKCWNLYKDDKTQCDDCPLRKGIKIGGTEINEEYNVLGNKIFEISHTGMMFKNQKAMLEIFQDITKRKENEKELLVAKEKAEESDKLKTAFLANMSHEIRTPMNGILGFASLLKEVDLENDKQKEYIEIIEKSGVRLLNIINEIINISKIESGQMSVSFSLIDINKSLDYFHCFFKEEAVKKNIDLRLTKALQNREVKISTDEDKLNSILSNLIKNALKYTVQGFIEFGYVINEINKEIAFYVKDTGVGIPTDRQTAIFERFIQADIENKMAQQGAGLGLTISKAYVEMLGGKLWLESEVNVGSTFHFTLPFINEKK